MTKKTNVISPNKSFRGWRFVGWIQGNLKTIKELIKVGIPFVVAWATTHNPALIVVITLFGKLILDSLDYYFGTQTK